MTHRIAADDLLALARDMLKNGLPAPVRDQARYPLALVAHAIDVARRDIGSEGDAALWSLLDEVYDDGEGSPAILAVDIRSGKVTDQTVEGLATKLRRAVEADLKIRNPVFLAARKAK